MRRWMTVLGILTAFGLLTAYAPAFALDQPYAQRIVFAPGATTAAVSGQIAATATDYWVLTAQAGQTLSANLSFASGQAILIIWGADGSVMISDHAETSTYSGVLPITQDYFIAVRGNPTTATSYTLNITIPPLAAPAPQGHRIQMAPGATTASVSGQVAALDSDIWVLTAFAGQALSANLSFASGQAILIVSGADGTVLLTDHATATNFTGLALPTTQDYYILVRGNSTTSTSYTLNISIPPLSAAAPNAQTITFGPGGTAASVSGQLAASGMDRWSVRAQAGQSMTAQLTFSSGQAILIAWGADGTVLLSDHAGVSAFNGVLPASQVYYIDVRGNPVTPTSYTLTVTIPPLTSQPSTRRIEFTPGGDSAAVQDLVAANSSNTWVIRAAAGQTMAVQIIYSTQPVVLSVTGVDGGVLLSDQVGAISFAGVLPSTQDYFVTVRGNSSIPASYTLTVTIPPK